MPLPETIIDSHHHLWSPEQSDPDIGYKWLRDIGAPKPFGDPTDIQRDYLLDELRGEQRLTTLEASVHLQCDPALPDPVAETRFVQEMSDQSAFDIAIVGFADLSKTNAENIIAQHKAYSRIRGMRQILCRLEDRADLTFAPEHFLHNDQWRENFALLGDADLLFDLQLYPEQMHDAADFLAQYPNIAVIIDHAGCPYDQSVDGLQAWKDGLTALAALPHVSIKLSGFGMYDTNWDDQTIKPMVDVMLDLFGPQRLLFGSNYPVDKLMATYDHILMSFEKTLSHLSQDDLNLIFYENAKRTYRP